MEQYHSVDAIVLKHHAVKEHDVILTLFSREQGKITVIAKGLQKSRSKLAGILQPLMRANITLVKGKQMYVVTGATLVASYKPMRGLYLHMLCALYFGDLLDRLLEAEAAEPELFAFLEDTLTQAHLLSPAVLCFYFEWRLLALLGYGLSVNACTACGFHFGSSDCPALLSAEGEFLCSDCSQRVTGQQVLLHAEDRAVLRVFQSERLSLLAAVHLHSEQIARLDRYFSLRYSTVTSYPLKSRKIVMEMLYVDIDKGF